MAEMTQPFQSFVDSFNSTNVKKIFGDPITAEGRTIIPVAKVSYGFGACGGLRPHAGGDGHEEQHEAAEAAEAASGGGGGGALTAQPLGVVEISQGQTRYIPIHPGRTLLGAAFAGLLVGLWLRR